MEIPFGMQLNEALVRGDQAGFRATLFKIAKAEGMTEISRITKIARPTLYVMLSKDGNPSFESIQTILKACGFTMKIEPTK